MLADWEVIKAKREDVISAIYQVYSQEKIMDLARVKGYALMKNSMMPKGKLKWFSGKWVEGVTMGEEIRVVIERDGKLILKVNGKGDRNASRLRRTLRKRWARF